MESNELLDEIWAIREEVAREADYDIDKHFAQLRAFRATRPLPNTVRRTPEETQRLLDLGDLPTAAVREPNAEYGQGSSQE